MPRGRPKGSKNKSKSKPAAPPAVATKPVTRVVLGRGKPQQPVSKPAASTRPRVVPEAKQEPKRRGRPPGSKNKPQQPDTRKQPKHVAAETINPVVVEPTPTHTGDVWLGGIRIQQKLEHRISNANIIVWTGTTLGQSPSSRFVHVKWDDGSIQFVPAVCIECAVEKKRRRRKRAPKTDQS